MSDSSISEYMKIRRYMMNVIYRANGQSVQVPTILELSRKFGVSRPTVSKAMKALTDEGYLIGKRGIGSFTNPNFKMALSSPLEKDVPLVGILIGDGMAVHYSSYSSQLLGALLNHLPYLPCYVHLVSLSVSDPEHVYEEIRNERLDGLVWHNPEPQNFEVCRRLRKEKFPLVLGGCRCDDIPSVDFDFEDAGYQCGKILYRKGCRNVIFFPNVFPWSLEAEGLLRAYREEGIILNENLFLKDCYTAHEKIRDILSYGIPVDAIYGQMLTYNTIEDYLLEIDPEIYKRCTLVASGGIVVPPRHPFHRLAYVVPFDEYGKKITDILKNEFSGNREPEQYALKITIESK